MVTQPMKSAPAVSSREDDPVVSFSHVQLYVDHVEELHVYKAWEDELNEFADAVKDCGSLEEKKALWSRQHHAGGITGAPQVFWCPQNRDIVRQLLSSFGFRVTGARYEAHTHSVMVTSPDPNGVQILVTSAVKNTATTSGVQQKDPSSAAAPQNGIFAAGKLNLICFCLVEMCCTLFILSHNKLLHIT